MFIKRNPRKGGLYYNVVRGIRDRKIVNHKKVLNLGRLDNLTPERKRQLETKIRELGEPKLLERFWNEIYRLGYRENIYPLTELVIPNLQNYGDINVSQISFNTPSM